MTPPLATTKLPLVEFLPQVQQTLSEIDRRTPNALRAALDLGYRFRRPNEDGDDDVASFLASVLPSMPAPEDDGDDVDHLAAELAELPFAREEYCYDRPEEEEECRLRMDWASCYLPTSDHDAHFGIADSGVVGVADGVGGYSAKGVDASAFARGLMAVASTEVLAAVPGTPICPLTLLERAYQETVASETPGASTAVILALVGDAVRWANVGDSGFAVLRGGTIVHRSQPQQHSHTFGCPYQLSSKKVRDGIRQAKVGETPVRDGDIVVVGTDGLFDNMFDAELERVVQMGTALGFSPKNMADVVAGIAYEISANIDKDSPYSVSHRKHLGDERRGGKVDDITVVVAYIVSAREFPTHAHPAGGCGVEDETED